ncbi:hypothetical protein K491DRAFT_80836 [Lophiostoma macrostomum CBS 122681]|uniref:Uncharacterized protein n=1 Tax=Lophiostoma macrostomum CBS 122681 TaxID=1314788 RepID=A0A6A6TMG4_9PLEO|nr:hypothetical protein K491DRAFT_80836 [Lophiostoma macrostomum CBS 122681]
MHWPWMCLPLRTLHLKEGVRILMPTYKPVQRRDGRLYGKCPTLRCLSMECSAFIFASDEMHYGFLPKTLARCDNIEKIEFDMCLGGQEIVGQDRPLSHWRPGTVDTLVRLIIRTAPKLRNLGIIPYGDQAFYDFVQPLTRLDQFVNLTQLSIPQAALLGAYYGRPSAQRASPPIGQLIPTSLVYLCIYNTKLTIWRWMEDLANHGDAIPNLCEIELNCDHVGKDSYEKFCYTEHMYPVYDELDSMGIWVHYGPDFEWKIDWNDEEYDPLTLDIVEYLRRV